MAQVRWSMKATKDLQEIEDYIARDSVLYAVAFVDRLVAHAEQVSEAPFMGRVVPEFRRKNLREVLYQSYRVVYLVQGEEVTVLRVVHGARDLRRLVRREPWELT